ncbi:hypothetical protein BN2476_520038 [Paraburkholderia piptadeniae]|uniref:Uncharacterized protein n=1 Tax=Paraburkholderia piptadeniae TaxID=1701573 RepID=A0A1N7SI30_9BURK|nr:hypothetical protein BN2476_520038 [Paraburkholderia piptadeniae]
MVAMMWLCRRASIDGSGSAAMTRVLLRDVIGDLAVNRLTVIDKQFLAGLDDDDGKNEHAIAGLDCLAVGCTRLVQEAGTVAPRLPSIAKPLKIRGQFKTNRDMLAAMHDVTYKTRERSFLAATSRLRVSRFAAPWRLAP